MSEAFEADAWVVSHDVGCPICTGWCAVCGGKLGAEWFGIRTCEACGARFTEASRWEEVRGVGAKPSGASRRRRRKRGGRSNGRVG